MKGGDTSNKSGHVRVELKYCEHCGGLWVGEGGAASIARVSGRIADLPIPRGGDRGTRRPSSPANCDGG